MLRLVFPTFDLNGRTQSFKQFCIDLSEQDIKAVAFDVSTPHPLKTFAHFSNVKNFPSSITVLTFFLLPYQRETFNENLYSEIAC